MSRFRRLDGVVEIFVSYHEYVAGSIPAGRVLFFQNLDIFKMVKKGWCAVFCRNLSSLGFFYAFDNHKNPNFIVDTDWHQNSPTPVMLVNFYPGIPRHMFSRYFFSYQNFHHLPRLKSTSKNARQIFVPVETLGNY